MSEAVNDTIAEINNHELATRKSQEKFIQLTFQHTDVNFIVFGKKNLRENFSVEIFLIFSTSASHGAVFARHVSAHDLWSWGVAPQCTATCVYGRFWMLVEVDKAMQLCTFASCLW